MKTTHKEIITVSATIEAPIEKVWKMWTNPSDIMKWNNASDDWCTTRAENDLRVGGNFLSRMEAKDGSVGFDFGGSYLEVIPNEKIAYIMADERKVEITFSKTENGTNVFESFEAEGSNPVEMQKQGWQAILNNFKKHVETSSDLEKVRFATEIKAPVEKVFQLMIDEKKYMEWTAAFNPTSYFKGSWEKGSKILFLGKDENGKIGGMVSRIKDNIPNEFISIEHLGIVDGEKEITSGPEVSGWAGAFENYIFSFHDGITKVVVEIDLNQEHKSYFAEKWPKALSVLKSICEN